MDSNLKYSKGLLLLCDDGNMPMEKFEVFIYNRIKYDWGINPMRLNKEIVTISNFESYLQDILREALFDLVIVGNIIISNDKTLALIDNYKNLGNNFRLINIGDISCM